MASIDLLYIGSILSVGLGVMALRLVRQNQNLPWNDSIAAQMICLSFIAKGISNACTGLIDDADPSSRFFWVCFNLLSETFFSFSMMILILIYPITVISTAKSLKMVSAILIAFMIGLLIIPLTGLFELMPIAGTLLLTTYTVGAIIWGSIFLKFRLEDNQSSQNLALLAGLLLVMLTGHQWFTYPGLFFQSDYYLFREAFIFVESSFGNYLWQFSLTAAVGAALMIFSVEVFQASQGKRSVLLYIMSYYIIAGLLRHFARVSDDVTLFWDDSLSLYTFTQTLSIYLQFTIIRPIIAMYILLKFQLIRVNDENRNSVKMMSIILIVIATSAVLELIQTFIPINQMISAALLGVIIAFGIGWEEKSINRLISSPINCREDANPEWFPEIELPNNLNKIIMVGSIIFLVMSIIVSYYLWQTGVAEAVMMGG
jgi:hypothetical protein